MTLTQREVEETMYQGGIVRATTMMKNAEENGEASRNPYAATLYRDFVLALSEQIVKDAAESRRPARFRGHLSLLAPLDKDAVAFLAVRTTLNSLLHIVKGQPSLRQVASAIGAAIHQELVLAQIEHLSPELYHTLANDFNRKKTKNVRHRLTVFRMQAKAAGIEWAEWAVTDREVVGMYLLDCLANLGLVDLDAPMMDQDGNKLAGKRTTPMGVRLTQSVIDTISRIKGFVSITSPIYGPCVEPPLDWSGFAGGGFHTPQMQRVHPYLVKATSAARDSLREHQMPIVYQAVNAMQKTAWRVNSRLLRTIRDISFVRSIGEIETVGETERPAPPEWLAEEAAPEARDERQEKEFRDWKRHMSEWYTERKMRAVRVSRYLSTVRAADTFKEYPAIYFVYFLDSRGRGYPMTYGINPQGSDLQKSLLHFAEGKPINDPDAERWFLIQGANKYGFDKAKLHERVQWSRDHHDHIMSFADNPMDNRGWEEADAPLQFLAWCFEYADWINNPETFQSHIPISMDGSCNGLQHFSAMLRDEVGGRATNLTDNEHMQDIYRMVADKTTELLLERLVGGEVNELIDKWIEHTVSRSVVKRPVMTTPYGITKRSAVMYVVEDYLRAPGASHPFESAQYYAAAQTLIDSAWEAIGRVVIKSRAAMDWLRKSAGLIVRARAGVDYDGVISWSSPSGFLATQAYYALEEHRVRTRLHGSTRILVVSESDVASTDRHMSGLAPNFVHSMDAAHLHLVAAAAGGLGIDALAMIHDDYGTHAADAQKLFTLIRVQFLDMYTKHDPIAEFAALYPECPKVPAKGTLDLGEVIYSDFFFS